MELSVSGDRRLIELLSRAGERGVQAVERATYETALEMFADSQHLVPVDTGALRASGQVHAPTRSGDAVEVVIGYGGAAAPYAAVVHEDLEARHAPGTQAKYLEVAVERRTQDWADRLAQRAEELLRP